MSHNFQLPKLNHPEIEVLYEYDLSIPKEKIATILALPRPTLIADLETILKDLIERHEYFQKNKEGEEWLEVHTHALWLLIELKAKKALPTVLQLLQQDNDFSEAWFGDALTEGYWQILYILGDDALEELKTFALTPAYWANRSVATSAVEMIAQHQPEKRAVAIEWFRSLVEDLLTRKTDDPALDEDFIGSIVVSLIHLKAVELLPLIKQLEDKSLIAHFITGDYASIEKDILDPAHRTYKRKVFTSIYEYYENVLSTWHGYRMKYDEAYKKENTYIPPNKTPFKHTGKKVGRNEPCPCGSGKKYKRCCLKK